MESGDELKDLTNELFRRMGRNLLNFQAMERMLKFLVLKGQLHGPISAIPDLMRARADSIRLTTMGPTAKRFFEEIMAGDEEPEPDLGPVEIKEPWISFSIAFKGDKKSKAEFRAELEDLVRERNELVHHLGAKWDQKSVASTRKLLEQMDEQLARVIPLFERLQAMGQAMKDCAEALASARGDG